VVEGGVVTSRRLLGRALDGVRLPIRGMEVPSAEKRGRIWVWVLRRHSAKLTGGSSRCGLRIVRSGYSDCSRQKLMGIAALVMPSPGYAPLRVASLAWERPAAGSSLMPPLVR
jgi:hypothetical protein